MGRRGQRKQRQVDTAALGDPFGMARFAREHYEWLRARNYSAETITNREKHLARFMTWASERGITRAAEVTKPILERYQRHLYHYRKKDGRPLTFASQQQHLSPVRAFFKWLARQNYILYNPASDLELPRAEHRLPKHVLTAAEVERVLMQPDLSDPLGVRDRAILETFYSTGMRRRELAQLVLYDLDIERGTVMIRLGKGKKDRMVPIGERATLWIRKYLDEVRPTFVVEPDHGTLFLTSAGDDLTPDWLTQVVRQYVEAANIGKHGSCHLFRHTMATLMLEGGADIRFIQAMLGHARLTATQIYTQVSIRKLKAIHTATHPAKLEPRRRSELSEAAPEAAEAHDDEPDDEC